MSVSLAVHQSSKILASLCISRPPLLLKDDLEISHFRNWRKKWLKENNHNFAIDDSLVFMHYAKHFLPSPEEVARKSGESILRLEISDREIDALVASEGLPQNQKKTDAKKIKTESSLIDKIKNIENIGKSAKENDLGRMPYDYLYLTIKRGGIWQLPWGNLREADSMKTTLKRIANEQLGFEPFFPANCPMTFQKIPGQRNQAKMFYYRGWVSRCMPQPGEGVEALAWLTREEISRRVSKMTWRALDPVLPLD